jgi:hypothetical protein
MTRTIRGTIHGQNVELDKDPGVPDGQDAEIMVRVDSSNKPTRNGEGFLVTEGALADDPYWDAIMEEVHHERKEGTL